MGGVVIQVSGRFKRGREKTQSALAPFACCCRGVENDDQGGEEKKRTRGLRGRSFLSRGAQSTHQLGDHLRRAAKSQAVRGRRKGKKGEASQQWIRRVLHVAKKGEDRTPNILFHDDISSLHGVNRKDTKECQSAEGLLFMGMASQGKGRKKGIKKRSASRSADSKRGTRAAAAAARRGEKKSCFGFEGGAHPARRRGEWVI